VEAPIKFGTDGWRGMIAEDYTFANVRRCTQGFAEYLLGKGYRDEWMVVGYDRRFGSEHFAAAAAEVLAGNGLRVWLTGQATPTPVIAYAVVEKQGVGAINITASHNPPADNGFKVRDPNGGAIDPEGLIEIEARIPPGEAVKRMPLAEAEAQGRVVKFDAAKAYIAHLRDLIDLEPIRAAGFKVLVEPMWGNGAGWFPRLLAGGQTTVAEIHSERNPIFPEMTRPEPIPPNVDVGLRRTVELGADVLLITDGDADRMGIGDENGRFLNQLQVYALLALYLLEVRGERGAHRQDPQHHLHARPPGADVRRAGARHRRGLQVRRPEDDGDERHDRRRGERRLRFSRQRARARRHSGQPALPGLHGEDGQKALGTARHAVCQGRAALLRPGGYQVPHRTAR
jgi:phosphomannomutase